jgi:hypothetical protein
VSDLCACSSVQHLANTGAQIVHLLPEMVCVNIRSVYHSCEQALL